MLILLPDREPDVRRVPLRRIQKANPGPVVAKAKLGRGEVVKKLPPGFAGKTKRKKNQGKTSRAQRNPI